MKNLVISGSAKLQTEIKTFLDFIKNKYNVLDYPKAISSDNFIEVYPEIYKNFFDNIDKCDTYLLFNCDKNGIEGYIGAAGFAELSYALARKLNHGKQVDIYILKMPSKEVPCHDEIKLYLELGWIKIWSKNEM